jgi:SAM-dependent methyltransferase
VDEVSDGTFITNAAQFEYWNDQTGHTWMELQTLLDRQLAPLGARAIAALSARPGEHVLDVGCGCGDTSLALARAVAPGGTVTGLDLSAPMLELARIRAGGFDNVSFVQADVQIARFAVPFDAVFSRFGVMFFEDPAAAFANIATAMQTGGRLAFVCWRAMAENVWMTLPLQAGLRHVPAPQADDPDAPGPFAFARAERVRGILEAAGFTNIVVAPHDVPIGGFDLETAAQLSLRVGPLGRLLREAPEQRDAVTESVREVLAGYVTADGMMMPSASWIVTADK